METDRIEQFLRDASGFCDNLRRALQALEREPENRELVHQAFRVVHSLKSEAQLLKLDDLGAVADEMEGILEQLRGGTLDVDSESLGILVSMLDAFDERLSGVEVLAESAENLQGEAASAIPHFSEFERELIQEAHARGESLYRMRCEIEESAPLKYPKAYLVVNNLELATNVIRSFPSFETNEDEAFRVFEVFFTASLSEREIRKLVDVDQVGILSVSEIAFTKIKEKGEVPPGRRSIPSTRRGPSTVRVENGRLDDIARRLRETEVTVERLRRLGGDDALRLDEGLVKLARDISEIERLVKAACQVPFSEEFRYVPWLVQDLARRLGKRVRLAVTGEAVRVDRRLLSMLSEPLVHLVRNAVDHGIEGAEERSRRGKDPAGTVVISAIMRDGELVLQIGDDGRGISREAIRARAKELGMGLNADEESGAAQSLLELLVRPGFSTRSESTSVSGRGVGLDAIYRKVRESLGGELRLQTQEGKGSLFTISVPGGASMMSLLMVRCGEETVGIPVRDIESMSEVSSATFDKGPDDSLLLDSNRLRDATGRVVRGNLASPSYPVVIVRRNGKRTPVLCDEVLFERDIPEERLASEGNVEHGIRRVRVGNTEADFLLLDVSVIE